MPANHFINHQAHSQAREDADLALFFGQYSSYEGKMIVRRTSLLSIVIECGVVHVRNGLSAVIKTSYGRRWQDRGHLCVRKHASGLQSPTPPPRSLTQQIHQTPAGFVLASPIDPRDASAALSQPDCCMIRPMDDRQSRRFEMQFTLPTRQPRDNFSALNRLCCPKLCVSRLHLYLLLSVSCQLGLLLAC